MTYLALSWSPYPTYLSLHTMNFILQLHWTDIVGGKQPAVSSLQCFCVKGALLLLKYFPHSLMPIYQANFYSSFIVHWSIRFFWNPVLVPNLLFFLGLSQYSVKWKFPPFPPKLYKDRHSIMSILWIISKFCSAHCIPYLKKKLRRLQDHTFVRVVVSLDIPQSVFQNRNMFPHHYLYIWV